MSREKRNQGSFVLLQMRLDPAAQFDRGVVSTYYSNSILNRENVVAQFLYPGPKLGKALIRAPN